MQIRRATIADVKTLSHLGSKTFYDTFTGTCTEQDMTDFLYEYFNEEQVAKELKDDDDYFYFCEVDGIAVGYIRIKEDNSGFDGLQQYKALELKRLYVLHDFHGKGVAQLLMNFVFDFAKQHSYSIVWLGVWEHNERAKAFYKKHGFIDTGYTHDFPIGNTPQTDLWYWKKL